MKKNYKENVANAVSREATPKVVPSVSEWMSTANKQSGEIATPFGLAMMEQRGRSMVEMLGVLAVIGVLSVAGIAGYTAAMRAHKANEIVNATSMCYMMGMSANAGTGGQQLVYSPKPDGVSSITFKDNNQIEIDGITDATLCAQVKNKLGDKSTECPNASPYKLTVTLGDVREITTPEGCQSNDDCYAWEKCDRGECKCVDYRGTGPNRCTLYCQNTFDFGGEEGGGLCVSTRDPYLDGSPIGHDELYCQCDV